jgi:hypothetical protein
VGKFLSNTGGVAPLIFNKRRTIKFFIMTQLVYLDKKNCTVDYISNRNNVIVTITTLELDAFRNVAMNKKYFNQINSVGYVEGRLRRADDGLWLFEGFNFK